MRVGICFRRLSGVTLLALCGCRTAPVRPAEVEGQPLPPLSAAAETRARALSAYARGLLAEYHRDYGDALTNFQLAASLDPEFEELAIRMSLLLLQERRAEEALAVLQRARAHRPDSEKLLRWTILVHRAANRDGEAEKLYEELIRRKPKSSQAYLELAGFQIQRGKKSEAARVLKRGLSQVEDPLPLLKLLAGLHLERGSQTASEEEKQAALMEARRLLEQARTLAPRDPLVLFQLADLYFVSGEIERGIEIFDAIEQEQATNPAIRQQLALTLMKVHRQNPELLDQLRAKAPAHPRLWIYLGEIYQERGEHALAYEAFSEAARAFSDDPGPTLRKAALLATALNKPKRACAELKRAHRRWPDDVRVLELLAISYQLAGDPTNALVQFRKRVAIADPEPTPQFLVQYALTAQAADALEEAAARLNEALQRSPVSLEMYLYQAFSQTDEKNMRRSLNVLQEVGRLQPTDPAIFYYLALLHSHLKEYTSALAAFEKAEQLLADSPLRDQLLDARFYFWYGAAAERSGDYARAEVLLERCLELDPNHAEALNYLAYMWAVNGVNLQRALAYVQRALEMQPTSAAFIDTLGWIYFRQGQYPEALEQLKRASELMPDDPTILEHLGDVLAEIGDDSQAEPYWRRAFLLDPTNADLERKLQRLNVDTEQLRREAGENPRPASAP